MSRENSLDEHQYDEFLLSLAKDFRRYYFERWRSEMASQRSSNQTTLFAGRIADLEMENKNLRKAVFDMTKQIELQGRCMNLILHQQDSTKKDLIELTNLVEDLIEKK